MRAAGRVFLLILILGGCHPSEEPGPAAPPSTGTRDPFSKSSGAGGSGGIAYRKRIALVVGINEYASDTLKDLTGPLHDATELADVLASRFGFDVTLLVDRAPVTPLPAGLRLVVATEGVTRARLVRELDSLRAGSSDAVLFYFAGHGVPGHLVPSDGQVPSRDRSTWRGLVPHEEVAQRLRGCDAHHTLTILDSCYSGTALAAMVKPLGTPAIRVEERDNLSRVFNRRAYQVITAGTGDEAVDDLVQSVRRYGSLPKDLEGHSPFTGVLLQGLRGLTGRPDGRLAASDLAYFLSHTLVNENESFRAKQAPRFGALGGGEGDFLFLPTRAVLNPKLVAPLYMAGPEYAQLRESACRALSAFVGAHPGDRVALARDAIPHLARLLRDPAAGPRAAAAETLGDLVVLGDLEDFRKAVPSLEALVADPKEPAKVRREAARALGRGARYADERALEALDRYVQALHRRWSERLGNREPPPEIREKAQALWERKAAALLDASRELGEWLVTRGFEILREHEKRHAEGKVLLQRAERYVREHAFFEARLAASESHDMLWPRSPEWERGRAILEETPDVRLLWSALGPVHHATVVRALALRPGGRHLASGSVDGAVRLWDVTTGALLRSYEGNRRGVQAIAFSSKGDLLASADWQGTVLVWEVDSGKKKAELDSNGLPNGLVFLDDSATVAVGELDGGIRILSEGAGSVVLEGHEAPVCGLIRCARGLISFSDDRTIRVWDVEKRRPILELQGHEGKIAGAALDDDGATLASVDDTGAVHLWDLASGRGRRLAKFVDPLWEAAFDPTGTGLVVGGKGGLRRIRVADGAVVWTDAAAGRGLAWSSEGTIFHGSVTAVRALDAATGRPRGAAPGPGSPMLAVAWSPDGRRFVSIDEQGRACLWDAKSRRPVEGVPWDPVLSAFAFSPDGRWIAVSTAIWRATVGKRDMTLRSRLSVHRADTLERVWISEEMDGIRHLAFHPEGELFVAAHGQSLSFWLAQSGRKLRETEAHLSPITALAFSPCGSTFATAEQGGVFKIWDAATGQECWMRRVASERSGAPVYSLAYHPTGSAVAVGTGEGTVALHLVATGEEARRFRAHTAAVRCLEFHPGDGTLLTAGDDGNIKVWNFVGELEELSISAGAWTAAFAPDGVTVLAGGGDGSLRFWSLGRSWTRRLTLPTGFFPMSIAMGPDGRSIVVAGTHEVVIHDVETGKLLRKWDVLAERVAVSPDGAWLAMTDPEQRMQVLNAETGEVRWQIREEDTRKYTQVAWDPRGRWLASGNENLLRLRDAVTGALVGSVRVDCWALEWRGDGACIAASEMDGATVVLDMPEGRERARIPHPRSLAEAVWRPGGSELAYADPTFAIHLYDVDRREEVRRFEGHTRLVRSLAFSPDGRTLASAGTDGTLRIWDAATGEQVRTFPLPHKGDSKIAFSADGRRVAALGQDRAVRWWPADEPAVPMRGFLGRYAIVGNDVVLRAESSRNLYEAEVSFSTPSPEASHLSHLERDSELWAGYFHHGNLPAALVLLRQMAKSEDQNSRAEAMLRVFESEVIRALQFKQLDLAARWLTVARSWGADISRYSSAYDAIRLLLEGKLAEAVPLLKSTVGLPAHTRYLLLLPALRRLKDQPGVEEILDRVRLERPRVEPEFEWKILDYYAGTTSEKDLFAAADLYEFARSVFVGEAHFYVGWDALSKGDSAKAERHFEDALKHLKAGFFEVPVARAELDRLRKK